MGKIEQIAPSGMRLTARVRELLNPMNWAREFKYDRQRKKRGWSDRDTWNGGDYILTVVSGVLKKLGDEKSHIDWDEYFKSNFSKNQGYASLQQVAEDIDAYLNFDEYAWGETLGFEIRHGSEELPDGGAELTSLNTPEEEVQIEKAIEKSFRDEKKNYKKAKKAMTFVAVNFPGLWD